MRKFNIILTSIFLMFFCMFTNLKDAFASTITKDTLYDYYFTRYTFDGALPWGDHYVKHYVDGRIAYCIEPGVSVTSNEYIGTTDISASNLDYSTIRKLSLIAHYGYEYSGHQTDRYYMATQNLIWESIGNFSITVSSELWGHGTIYDLSPEKNEIMRLVNNHDVKPSFHNATQTIKLGDTITLKDSNNVLNNYQVAKQDGNLSYSISNNNLVVKGNALGTQKIYFASKDYDIESTIIYKAQNSQTLGVLRLIDPSSAIVNLNVIGGDLEVNKLGEELVYENDSYKYNVIPLESVKFELYADENIFDLNNNLIFHKNSRVDVLTTDTTGLVIRKNLYYGKYFLKEITSSNGNIVDNTKYEFEVTPNNLNIKLELKNYLAKGTLDFSKIDISTHEPLPNTKIEIRRTEDDLKIFEGVTDENGKIVIDNLPVDKYYMVELEAPEQYILNTSKMYFEVKENGEIVRCTMTNEKVIEVEVPKTGENDYSFLIISIISLIIVSISGVLYVKD